MKHAPTEFHKAPQFKTYYQHSTRHEFINKQIILLAVNICHQSQNLTRFQIYVQNSTQKLDISENHNKYSRIYILQFIAGCFNPKYTSAPDKNSSLNRWYSPSSTKMVEKDKFTWKFNFSHKIISNDYFLEQSSSRWPEISITQLTQFVWYLRISP